MTFVFDYFSKNLLFFHVLADCIMGGKRSRKKKGWKANPYIYYSVILALAVIGLALFKNAGLIHHRGGVQKVDIPVRQSYDLSCITSFSAYEVRGASLAGVIRPGSCVVVLEGYYGCNPVKKGDIAAYRYGGDTNLIIKVVKGVPGDAFALNGSNILINGKTATNSDGKPYVFSNVRMLSLYAKDYPVIPKNTYLILGNMAGGSLDSSRFGLVDKSDIIGMVQRCT